MNSNFAVLNPGGNDRTQIFAQGAGNPQDVGHPPVNYHAYAACMNGGFYDHEKTIPPEVKLVLILLRRKGLDKACRAIEFLKKSGVKTLISWKESGLHQVAEALETRGNFEKFREAARLADGYLSSTPELEDLYRQAGCSSGEFLATPYPVDIPAWDFSKPLHEREGVLIGTREFGVWSRNHRLALAAVGRLSAGVTVINPDGRAGERALREMGLPRLRIINGRMPYSEYLQLVARHRLVFQLDRSAVPGQVAGDALLARTLCLGGDGAVDRIGFPDLWAKGRSVGELTELAARLLREDAFYCEQLDASQAAAQSHLSFAVGRARLERLMPTC